MFAARESEGLWYLLEGLSDLVLLILVKSRPAYTFAQTG